MKIALPVYLHGFGGAERQVITLANQMANRGHDVHMLLLSDDKIKYPLSEKVNIHSLLNAEKGNLITRILNRRKALIKALHYLNCDVVVNFNFQSVYMLTVTSKTGLGKILYSERGDPGDKEYKGLMGILRKYVLHKIDAYVFQSDGARDYFKDQYVRDHSVVIPNACFIKPNLKEVITRSKRIVTVGRLSAQKNQRVLIESFSKIASQFDEYNLDIYGDGELKDELTSLIDSLSLTDRIRLMGTTKDVTSAIKDASLFVLSSDYEGIPNALIEAMAIGLPCISTDCKPGGARTLIKDGYDGLITPIGNADELASAIKRLLADKEEANLMGTRAAQIVERLSPKVIYDKWEQFFQNVCL